MTPFLRAARPLRRAATARCKSPLNTAAHAPPADNTPPTFSPKPPSQQHDNKQHQPSPSPPNTFTTTPPAPSPSTIPPGFTATIASLPTFTLPSTPIDRNCPSHLALGRALAACVDDRSYAGYIASGEEVTAGVADYSEVFTVTKEFERGNGKVKAGWPCHGPCPWPEGGMGRRGEGLLRLAEMGLGGVANMVGMDRFPPRNMTNGKGKEGRGIGSHTDYGLLVISAQDDVGGLFIRRPSQDEQFANWKESAAGLREDDEGWVYVPPVEGVFTVILGDMMQYLTRNYLSATPHKVGLNTRERFVIAYFHEPSFQAVLKPLTEGCGGQPVQPQQGDETIADEPAGNHYGTHFTNMFMRAYPDRITTRRLVAEDRYRLLATPELRSIGAVPVS
ncbi:hypothetical protein C8A05DRAFT_41404 [Staphylotrichum tortipilum]|uniref:Fe2OG dioxygenase domain-containing protein n=1 Tax=Staphylotrichum tortipilum TaxID=2831512 RepID=A0AAN6MSK8_9PEZI|nr:hypothetical protein C8A05DRAFT_41404 [Staphylotrichum longicolle]